MAGLKVESIYRETRSVDDGLNVVGGIVYEFTNEATSRAVRVCCGRNPIGCQALISGQCQTAIYESGSGRTVHLKAPLECGQTSEGLAVANEIL